MVKVLRRESEIASTVKLVTRDAPLLVLLDQKTAILKFVQHGDCGEVGANATNRVVGAFRNARGLATMVKLAQEIPNNRNRATDINALVGQRGRKMELAQRHVVAVFKKRRDGALESAIALAKISVS